MSPKPYLSHSKIPYIVAWGVMLAIGILAYYRVLALGPISIVVSSYGRFIAVSSVIGLVVFEEQLTTRKMLGIGFAVLAVVLMSL